MAGIFGDYGNPSFGLRDVKIADLTNDNGVAYGTAVDLPSVQMLEVNYQTVNAQLEGDDVIRDVHAFAIAAQIRVRFGSVPFDALEVLTGKTQDTYGTTPNRIASLTFDGLTFPYFGLCGKVIATQGSGDIHIFVPKMKIMEGFTFGFQYGQYAIPELTCMAVPNVNNKIFEPILHETAADVALPPVYS